MKTAAQVCKDLKNRDRTLFENSINNIVRYVEENNGSWTIPSHYVDPPLYDFPSHRKSDYFFVYLKDQEIVNKLQELGFKITFKDDFLEYQTTKAETKEKVALSFFGFSFGKKEVTIRVPITVKVPIQIATITACCGEDK